MGMTHMVREELHEIAESHVNRGYSDDSLTEVKAQIESEFEFWYKDWVVEQFLKDRKEWK